MHVRREFLMTMIEEYVQFEFYLMEHMFLNDDIVFEINWKKKMKGNICINN